MLTSPDMLAEAVQTEMCIDLPADAAFIFGKLPQQRKRCVEVADLANPLMTAFGSSSPGSKQTLTKPRLLSDRAF